MHIILISLVMAVVLLPLALIFKSDIPGWIIWVVNFLLAVFLLVKSFTEYFEAKKGVPKTFADHLGMAVYPFSSSLMIIILIIFLFTNFSKLHLLWISTIVSLLFEFTIGKKTMKILRPYYDGDSDDYNKLQ